MQQQNMQHHHSWPPATWFEDALGFPEEKRSYIKNQQVLLEMQQRASQAGFPHSMALGSAATVAADSAAATADMEHVQYGEFSCPTVQQLREECQMLKQQLDEHQQQQQHQQHSNGAAIVWHTLSHTNVLHLYANCCNNNDKNNNCDSSTFQAASQFNCLEMTGPSVTPESGIAQYVRDRTQGPASAMACAAGTAFRNYLVHVDNVMQNNHTNNTTNNTNSSGNDNNNNDDDMTSFGQTKNHQINTLADILAHLEQRVPPVVVVVQGDDDAKAIDAAAADRPLICVRNGYAEATEASLRATHDVLLKNDENEEDEWIRLGRVGIQHETQVTFPPTTSRRRRLVTQVYCSAVPIAYSEASAAAWEPLAKIVLKACYEATLLVAVRNVARAMLEQQQQQRNRCHRPTNNNNNTATQHQQQPSNNDDTDDDDTDDDDDYNAKLYRLGRVYLTKVGGGVFGNDEEWILNAMRHAHKRVSAFGIPLNVFIVNFGPNSPQDELLVQQLQSSSSTTQ